MNTLTGKTSLYRWIILVVFIGIFCGVQVADAGCDLWTRDSNRYTLEPNEPNDWLDVNDVNVGGLLIVTDITGTIPERLGLELVTNGTFWDGPNDWNEIDPYDIWSISDGGASFDPDTDWEDGDLYQDIAIETGRKYRVKFSIPYWSGDYISDPSTLEVKLGNVTVANLSEGETGNYSYDVTCTGGNKINFYAHSGYETLEPISIGLDNVSVKEVLSENTVRDIYVDPNLFVEVDLDVGGDANVAGNLDIKGDLTLSGSTYLPKGTIHHAYVAYKDSDTVTIKVGYGECNGSYWEITSDTDHDMTSLASGEDFHYIYIDDSTSSYPTPTIIDSTTEPSWSDGKMGWYNSNDRCIGVVWSPDSSTTIESFYSNSNQEYIAFTKAVLVNGNPDGTRQTCEATAYIPVNAIAVRLCVFAQDLDGYARAVVTAYESYWSEVRSTGTYAHAAGWVELERGASRDLKWLGYDDDDNAFTIYLRGYRLER